MEHPAIGSSSTVLVFDSETGAALGTASIAVHGRDLQSGEEFVSVRFTSGPIMDIVAKTEMFQQIGERFSYFRYYPNSGLYQGRNYESESEYGIMQPTMICDDFNFEWGMVPEHFEICEGYAAKHRAAIAEPEDGQSTEADDEHN